nr:hypothetical protein [Tanacetum cinerariifolium]
MSKIVMAHYVLSRMLLLCRHYEQQKLQLQEAFQARSLINDTTAAAAAAAIASAAAATPTPTPTTTSNSSDCHYLERIVTASGPGFNDWQWRLPTLPFAFRGLGVYCAGDVLNYAFLASRLQSAGLHTKLLRLAGIFDSGPNFDDALCVFYPFMETDIMSNSSEIAAPKLMKKLADIYFTRVANTAESTFSLSPRQMSLWKSQMEDHTSDWLRVVPISCLGLTMNACSRLFTGDIYGDHAISCAGVIGIKRRHNVVRDTLVDICYRSGISAGKKVDIGLDGGRDKPLSPADMLLYSWDSGLDVCVDLTGSSPLTQTGMTDFVPGRAVIDAAQRKRVKYEAKVVGKTCPKMNRMSVNDGDGVLDSQSDDEDGVLDSQSDDGDGVLDSQTEDVIEEAAML